MPEKYSLDRETYRAVKKMDRAQMEQMLTNVYVSGKNDAESACIDFDELRTAIGQIKGIGESRLNEIMDVIQSFMENTEN